MRGAYCCRAMARVNHLCPEVERGRKRWERGGCECWMGWDLLAVPCAGGRERSDGRETTNREKEWKPVERLVTSSMWLTDARMSLICSSPSVAPNYGRGSSRRVYSKN